MLDVFVEGTKALLLVEKRPDTVIVCIGLNRENSTTTPSVDACFSIKVKGNSNKAQTGVFAGPTAAL